MVIMAGELIVLLDSACEEREVRVSVSACNVEDVCKRKAWRSRLEAVHIVSSPVNEIANIPTTIVNNIIRINSNGAASTQSGLVYRP